MERILIIQTAFIGDVVLATALIEALHEKYPSAAIDVLVRKGNEGLFYNHPFLNNCLVWDKGKGKYSNLFATLGIIRKTRYDLLVNCQRFAASGFLAAFSRARYITGFKKNPFSFMFNYKAEHEIGNGLHETQRNMALVAHLGLRSDAKPKLYPPPADPAYTAEKYVCLAPASVWFTKQWPEHKWVSLVQSFPKEICVYFLGGPGDRELCERIIRMSGSKKARNLCGSLNLLQSAGLMKGALMNYVNDSAPLHFCSAVNAPVTAFFCSTVPRFGFGPLSDQSFIAETSEILSCRPCGLHGYKACPLGHFLCAESIPIPEWKE